MQPPVRLSRRSALLGGAATALLVLQPRGALAATASVRPDLASIKTPITLVYPWSAGGASKPIADQFYRAQFAAAGGGVTFVDIGDSGHFAMLDQPEAFAAAVRSFLGDR